jgi:preflagellin peptidase FlaK
VFPAPASLGLVEVGPVAATATDWLRLLAAVAFVWAAYRDVQVRRVPSRTWYPLVALGVALLAFEVYQVQSGGRTLSPYARRLFFMQIAVSLGVVVPVSYLVWRVGGFGGADAKALMALAVLFPGYPNYALAGGLVLPLPAGRTAVGAFALTILTNTVLLGAAYPVALAARNLLAGDRSRMLLFGRPAPAESIVERHGSLLETPEGYTRRGLDIDALRMYLRWRGLSLAELRADPGACRDPASLPENPNPPGDGSIEPAEDADAGPAEDVATDGGSDSVDGTSGAETDTADTGGVDTTDTGPNDGEGDGEDGDDGEGDGEDGDPWGAGAFLEDIEGDAYGTTPEKLREGLEVIVAEDVVWISPGLPFIVPMFLGLVVSLVYGDALVAAVSLLT